MAKVTWTAAPTPAEKAAAAERAARRAFKGKRQEKVDAIVVTTQSGKTFDGDETSQNRMTRAVVGLKDGDLIEWVLADNSVAGVSRQELAEALYLAGREQSLLWLDRE